METGQLQQVQQYEEGIHGTDLYTVSKMIGHKHIKTTQVYAKVVDTRKDQTVNRIKVNISKLNMIDSF